MGEPDITEQTKQFFFLNINHLMLICGLIFRDLGLSANKENIIIIEKHQNFGMVKAFSEKCNICR